MNDQQLVQFVPTHVRVVDVHGQCFLREKHSIGYTQEGHDGCGLLILHVGWSLLFHLTKVLHS